MFNKSFVIIALNFSFLFFISFINLISQSTFDKSEESKTFSKNPLNVIRSNYLDAQGIPSHNEFLNKWDIVKREISKSVIPYFQISFLKDNVEISENKSINLRGSDILNIDLFLLNTTSYQARKIAIPIWDGRVYLDNDDVYVGGYSSKFNERPVGTINYDGSFEPILTGELTRHFPLLQIPENEILYDPFEDILFRILPNQKSIIDEKIKDFLPFEILSEDGKAINDFNFAFNQNSNKISLDIINNDGSKEIAVCNLTDLIIHELIYGYRPQISAGCTQNGDGEIITIITEGNFTDNVIINDGKIHLTDYYNEELNVQTPPLDSNITIDGKFDDWINISGIDDYDGDYVSYLFPNPDTDLLEFKIDNDSEYLYLYTRVSGAHGRTGEKGRYYWYAYIDIDADPHTGYPPTRDDNCYFGIPIGDDSEAQFEFIGNKFIKTFFGFTGIGAEKEVLSGKLKLGPSYYSSKDANGNKREKYKIEYVNREGSRFITHDYTEGTSEDIIIGLSSDGSQVEMRVSLSGFLKNEGGEYLLESGKKIDIAVGVEASSDYYDSNKWGADSSPVIYGYQLK